MKKSEIRNPKSEIKAHIRYLFTFCHSNFPYLFRVSSFEFRVFREVVHTNSTRSQRGQGLIEVLVALTIAMIVLTALSVAAVTSIRNATFSKNQSQANAFARQAMETIRAYRDIHSLAFFAKGDGCYVLDEAVDITLGSGSNAIVSEGGAITDPTPCSTATGTLLGNNVFTRKIAFDENGNDLSSPALCPAPIVNDTCINVIVYILWTDASGVHKSELSTILAKWQ